MRINYQLFFFSIMLFLLAFDIRSFEGDSKLFIIIRAALGLIFGFLAMRKIKPNVNSKNLILVAAFFGSYIFFIGLIRGQEIFQLFALTMPYAFFLLSILIVSSSLRDIDSLEKLINTIFIIALISVIFRILYVTVYAGISIDEARYTIISPALILLFSYGLTSLLYGYKKNWLLPISISTFITLLSVTRTYLLVFLCIFIFAICVLRLKSIIKNIGLPSVLIFGTTFFILGGLSITSSFLDVWSGRLTFDDGGILADPTLLTRVAEITFQIRVLLENNLNMIFGMGVAAETRFAQEFYDLLSMVFREDYEYIGAGVGHNNYVGLVYVGGIILGSLFVLSQLNTMLVSFTYLRKSFRDIRIKNSESFIALWGAFSTIGYLSYGMFGGIFGDRLASLSFGIAYGLMLLGIYRLQKTA